MQPGQHAALAGQGSAYRENGRDANGAYPSDEEILGMDSAGSPAVGAEQGGDAAATRGAATDRRGDATSGDPRQTGTDDGEALSLPRRTQDDAGTKSESVQSTASAPPAPEWLAAHFADAQSGVEAQRLWETHQAYREIFPTVAEARAVKELFPGGAVEAKQLAAQSQDINRLDAAYFSAEPGAQAQLAEHLLRDNPRAFQAMLRQSAEVLARRDPQGFQQLAEQLANHSREIGRGAGGTQDAAARAAGTQPGATPAVADIARQRQQLEQERGEFRATQFASFQQSANDAVVGQVRQSIVETIGGALPEGVPEGARKRIAEDVFLEIHTTLQSDPALTRQVAGLLSAGGGWQFDDATRQQVISLIFSRAKSLLPGVAKRVVNDWTTSVLSANREKSARQQAAAGRVDIAGGGAPESVGKRTLQPRDIDYTKTSDDQILSM